MVAHFTASNFQQKAEIGPISYCKTPLLQIAGWAVVNLSWSAVLISLCSSSKHHLGPPRHKGCIILTWAQSYWSKFQSDLLYPEI